MVGLACNVEANKILTNAWSSALAGPGGIISNAVDMVSKVPEKSIRELYSHELSRQCRPLGYKPSCLTA